MGKGKKITALLLALAAAGTMTAGLVACDDNDDSGKQEQTTAAEKLKDGGTVSFTNGTASIDLTEYVKANGNSYRVAVSNQSVATASVSGNTLTVTKGDVGTAIVTVVCGDVQITFSVVVAEAFYNITLDGEPVVPEVGEKWAEGATYTLPSAKESDDPNKEFKGWDVNGTTKQAGDEITVNGDLTITAIFEQKAAAEVLNHPLSVSVSAEKTITLTIADYIAAYGREVSASTTDTDLITVTKSQGGGTIEIAGVAQGTASLTLSTEGVTVTITVNVHSANMPTFENKDLNIDLFTQESNSVTFTPQEPETEDAHTYSYEYTLQTQNLKASITGSMLTFTPGADYDIAEEGATVSLVVNAAVTIDGDPAGSVSFTVTVRIQDTAPAAPQFNDVTASFDPFGTGYELTLKAEDDNFTYTYTIGETPVSGSKTYTTEADETVNVAYTYKNTTLNKSGTTSFKVKLTFDETLIPAVIENAVTVGDVDLALVAGGEYTVDLSANLTNSGNVASYTVNSNAVSGTTYTISNDGTDYGEAVTTVTLSVMATLKNDRGTREYTYTVNVTDTTAFRVVNAGFETGDLTGWTVLTEGWKKTGDKPDGVISAQTYWAEQLPYNQSGDYHLDGWNTGIGESDTWQVRSTEFTLGGSGWISVKMGGHAAAIKVYKADNTLIGEYRQSRFSDTHYNDGFLAQGGSWADMANYAIDLSAHLGEKLYVELCDIAVDGWAHAFFDDVITYYKTAPDWANLYDTVINAHVGSEPRNENDKVNIPWVLADNYLDQVMIVNKAPHKVLKETSAYDITTLLNGVTAKYGAAETPVTDIRIVSVTKVGSSAVTSGFDAFDLTAGEYFVTYRATYAAVNKFAEATFTIAVYTDNTIANGGFESGDLAGWTVVNGSIDLFGGTSTADHNDWVEHLPYNKTGNYFCSNAGLGEHAAWELKSTTFTLAGNGYISFKMGSNTAILKVFKADGTQIYSYRCHTFSDTNFPHVENGGNWCTMRTHYADLSAYKGEELYITIGNSGADEAWGFGYFDDIVTYYAEDAVMTGRQDDVLLTCTNDALSHDPGTTTKMDWIAATNEYVAPTEE